MLQYMYVMIVYVITAEWACSPGLEYFCVVKVVLLTMLFVVWVAAVRIALSGYCQYHLSSRGLLLGSSDVFHVINNRSTPARPFPGGSGHRLSELALGWF